MGVNLISVNNRITRIKRDVLLGSGKFAWRGGSLFVPVIKCNCSD
jgi:hypothetical protein